MQNGLLSADWMIGPSGVTKATGPDRQFNGMTSRSDDARANVVTDIAAPTNERLLLFDAHPGSRMHANHSRKPSA
jgi:hypothetical protein